MEEKTRRRADVAGDHPQQGRSREPGRL